MRASGAQGAPHLLALLRVVRARAVRAVQVQGACVGDQQHQAGDDLRATPSISAKHVHEAWTATDATRGAH